MIYITGANGFIGSHLVKRFDKYTAIPHDEIQTTKIEPFDYFYFLSSYGNMADQDDEYKIFKANVEDLLSVLMQIKNYRFKSFVYVSTSSVRLKTQTTYSRSKKAAEEILLAFMEKHNLPICIIRPFSVTGVGEQDKHLIPTLLKAAKLGTEINFVPNPTHDFIDVEDVVDGIINLSQHSVRGIYELGTGKNYTNQQVLGKVEEVTGKSIKTNIVPRLREYDNDNWVSNNFKARGYGWLPKKSLDQSIREMYEKS